MWRCPWWSPCAERWRWARRCPTSGHPAPGNAAAAEVASASPLISSARKLLSSRIAKINDRALAATVRDLVENPSACVRHRANQTVASKQAAVAALNAAGLYTLADAAGFPGGVFAGVFPPVVGAGSACPRLPQPFHAAPGGGVGGHHSYPGGLVLHETVNEFALRRLGLQLPARLRAYGPGRSAGGRARRPRRRREGRRGDRRGHRRGRAAAPRLGQDPGVSVERRRDGVRRVQLRWQRRDRQLRGAGGLADRSAPHHRRRRIDGPRPRAQVRHRPGVRAQQPDRGEYKVVNWLRAAAILAGVDPVAKGYLRPDKAGRLRLPALNRLADFDRTRPARPR